jgi:peptidoglycan/xylan/chitin deacetylase (PgdA/CDA1 family)
LSTDTFPVVIGTCLDAEAIWFNKIGENEHRPVMLSNGAYAIREGLDPLLDLFDRHGVRSTFFIPGVTADRYPDAVRQIGDRGHELASHTYSHMSAVGTTREAEKKDLVAGIDALEKITGERPATWRSASWEFTENTLDLLIEAGITVSANYHDTSRPYRHERDGKPLPIVELPVQWHLTTAPFPAACRGPPQPPMKCGARSSPVLTKTGPAASITRRCMCSLSGTPAGCGCSTGS